MDQFYAKLNRQFLNAINLNIIKVKGYSNLILKLSIIKNIMLWIILYIIFRYGIIGILIGQIIHSLLALIPNTFYSNKLIGYNYAKQIRDYGEPLLIAFIMAGVAMVIQWFFEDSSLLMIAVAVILSLSLYLMISYCLKIKGLSLTLALMTNRVDKTSTPSTL